MQRSLSVDQFQTVTVNHRELLSETGSNQLGDQCVAGPGASKFGGPVPPVPAVVAPIRYDMIRRFYVQQKVDE